MQKQVGKTKLIVLAIALLISLSMLISTTMALFSASGKITGTITFDADFQLFTTKPDNTFGINVSYGTGKNYTNINGNNNIIISFSKIAFAAQENLIALSNNAKSSLSKFKISAKFSAKNCPFQLSITPTESSNIKNKAVIKWGNGNNKAITKKTTTNDGVNTTLTIALSEVIKDIEILDTITTPITSFSLSISATMIN